MFLSLSVVVCACFMAACNKEAPEVVTENKRLQFIKGKTLSEIKAAYRILALNEAKELWINKLQQIQSQQVPDAQRAIIHALGVELSRPDCKFSLENDQIRTLGIQLASITPGDAFVQMFESLDNYKYNISSTKSQICDMCVSDLQNYRPLPPSTLELRAADCNCRWTCGMWGLEYKTDCNKAGGCGLFFLGSCNGYQ